MSSYVNVGAYIDGKRAKSKKALREALADDPRRVVFDPTSMFDVKGDPFYADELPSGERLSLCGPDPYRDRRFYGEVWRDAKSGAVKVK